MVRGIFDWYFTEVGSRVGVSNDAVPGRPTAEPRVFHENAFPAVLLNDATGTVGAIVYLSYAALFLHGGLVQELRPAVFP